MLEMKLVPTYVFEDDQVFAFVEGKVIAAGDNLEETEEEAAEVLKRKKEKDEEESDKKKIRSATHVNTPNGLRGKIISRTASWDSDENVTVAFENGRKVNLPISKLPVESFVTEQQKVAGTTPISSLETRVEASYEHDKDSLAARKDELQNVAAEASQLLSKGASYTDEQKLDSIVVMADAERSEISEALEHLEQADAEAFDPFEPQVVEQAQLGTQDAGGSWLDQAQQEMIQEAEGQDFEKTLDEGPIEFVAELPDAALADTGVAASAARDYITAKTAGVLSNDVEKYQDLFVERVEEARRKELASRKTIASKEASVEESSVTNGPDEGLFL